MSKLQSFKRLIIEDFDEKERDMVSKIAYSVNTFADDVLGAFNKNISIDDNLNIVKKDITVTVNTLGVPTSPLTVSSGLSSICVGMQVINATNLTNSTTTPTGTPFITFSDNGSQITISKITNLQASNSYRLKLILYV